MKTVKGKIKIVEMLKNYDGALALEGAGERSIGNQRKYGMDELTEQYLSMLKETSGCISLHASHIRDLESKIEELRAELKEKEQKLLHFMTKDSFSISRHDFRSFFVTVKNRKETDAEWDTFQDTFRFRLQLEIYKWIDSLEQ